MAVEEQLTNAQKRAKERARKLGLQEKGRVSTRAEAAAAMDVAAAAGDTGALDVAATKGRRGIRRAAARNLAGAMAGTPTGGGAGLAMARQSAADAGSTLGEFDTAVAQRRRGIALEGAKALQAAQEKKTETLEYEASEIASATADTQAKMAAALIVRDKVVADNKNWWGDDVHIMSARLLSQAELEDDPEVRDYYLKQAMDVLDGATPRGGPAGWGGVTLSDGSIYTHRMNPVDV